MTNLFHYMDIAYDAAQVLVMWEPGQDNVKPYAECFRVHDGHIGAAHPLSLDEGQRLAQLLAAICEEDADAYIPKGLLPKNVLLTRPGKTGCAIWHTPAMKTELLFVSRLEIPDGPAFVPPLLWKATHERLRIFALTNGNRPTPATKLLRAPFHNVNSLGDVCMGNVTIDAGQAPCLEDFITRWQQLFFRSTFTHHNEENSPVKGDLNTLWRQQMATGQPFPIKQLNATTLTLKHLL